LTTTPITMLPGHQTMSGWPKPPGPERIDRLTYPYDLTSVLQLGRPQGVDVELNV
jgi:hypothetical protein